MKLALPIAQPASNARCSGHCCRTFVLSKDYFDVVAAPSLCEDGETVVSMLIPLIPMLSVRDADWWLADNWPQMEYTCKHFDYFNNDCKIYEQRPMMCRGHGTKYTCRYDGCTLPKLNSNERAKEVVEARGA
jgi:Fe-S-cluster containining protein